MANYKIVKDWNGNILYKILIKDEPTNWNATKKCKKCNKVLPLNNFLQHNSSLDGFEHKCTSCRYSTNPIIKDKCCHACKKTYNNLYKAKKYINWDEYKKSNHHWQLCNKIQERMNSYIPSEGSVFTDNMFDTTILSIDIRYKLLNNFERNYISLKHLKTECQPCYIDNIITAYNSDIMKGILLHEK